MIETDVTADASDMTSPQCAQAVLPPQAQTETAPGVMLSSIARRVAVSSSAVLAHGYPYPVKAGPATRFATVNGARDRGNT